MTRKSRREIEQELEALDPGEIPADVGIIEQYLSDDYPDPPKETLSQAWVDELRPNNATEE